MNATIQNIVAQVPAWRQARSITIEPQKGGLTNANYLLTVDGERFVLRVSGDHAAQLGINRQSEYEALMAVSAAGIAPQVLLFTLPEGHLITHFVQGREWTMEEFKAPEVIRCVAETMRRVHALPAIEGAFSPYRDIERRLDAARSRQTVLPENFYMFLDKLYAIEQERAEKASSNLCHNDPFHNNFIVSEGHEKRVYLLDWEFAGMGDLYFDLASVSYFFSTEQKDHLLECYFGEATNTARQTLDQLWYVVAFWNATWALLQMGNPHADFDYSAMVKNVFARMATTL